MSPENHAARRDIGGRPDWSPLQPSLMSRVMACGRVIKSRNPQGQAKARPKNILCALCASVVNKYVTTCLRLLLRPLW